ncbi:MAG TPA: M42 family peptidase [Bacteroidetes bacterium]|nr:M42 family peptidase [Bacteroidota bacterium]
MDLKLLKKICETPGAPGFESKIRELVIKEIKPHVHELRTDNMGNLIALIKGREQISIMASAHLDEIGFIVTHIDDQGFIFFHTLGGFDPKTLTAQRVIIHGKKDIIGVMGSKPIHIMSAEEKTKAPKINDFFIDTGLSIEEVKRNIEIGCPITRERSLIVMGDNINCKSLDNRISVYILIEAIKKLKNPPYDFYAVFSVQEEVGIRGAQVAAHQINPDFGLGIDTTIAYDVPGAKDEEMITKLGGGVAIKVMDASTICDTRMVAFLKESAAKNKIPFQLEILTAGGTDTANIQRMGKHGSIAGAISIPTRHIHQVIEMVNKKDVLCAIDLLCSAVNKMDKYKWDH